KLRWCKRGIIAVTSAAKAQVIAWWASLEDTFPPSGFKAATDFAGNDTAEAVRFRDLAGTRVLR
ncbi:MAG: hypothetical protein WBZ01_09725, partial [Terriglobales bacterium]